MSATDQEIHGLLEAALDVNLVRLTDAAKVLFLKGWQAVVEVALVKFPCVLFLLQHRLSGFLTLEIFIYILLKAPVWTGGPGQNIFRAAHGAFPPDRLSANRTAGRQKFSI